MGADTPGLFDYRGPAQLLEPVRGALAWVRDPAGAGSVLAAARVRSAHVQGDWLHVVLALPPGPLVEVTREDAQAELFDHLQGRLQVRVTIVTPPGPGASRQNPDSGARRGEPPESRATMAPS
jgi:hypothetical protein